MLFNRKSQRRDEEAIDWLMRLTEREEHVQEAFYAWLLRSHRNVGAFLAVAEIYRKLDGLDVRRRIDVDRLIAESEGQIVSLRERPRNPGATRGKLTTPASRWRMTASIA